MPKKIEKNNLVVLQHGTTKQEFDVDHAERILRMKNNGGWALVVNDKHEFTQENGITPKK
jgi:hypothetical protein